MIEGLGGAFLGTSNCLIAMRREVEAIGTNAHELPMVYSALAENDRELAEAPYRVLADWQQDYDGNLRVMLPDTYGSRHFLERAPEWVTSWTGIRIDSGDPIAGGEIAIAWWQRRQQDPRQKLLIFSDGLDVDAIERIHRHFHGRVRIGYGWGTLLTNDFRGLGPDGRLDPFSIVCKVVAADGRPAVKLSDNPDEGHGPRCRARPLPARVPARRASQPARHGVTAGARLGALALIAPPTNRSVRGPLTGLELIGVTMRPGCGAASCACGRIREVIALQAAGSWGRVTSCSSLVSYRPRRAWRAWWCSAWPGSASSPGASCKADCGHPPCRCRRLA